MTHLEPETEIDVSRSWGGGFQVNRLAGGKLESLLQKHGGIPYPMHGKTKPQTKKKSSDDDKKWDSCDSDSPLPWCGGSTTICNKCHASWRSSPRASKVRSSAPPAFGMKSNRNLCKTERETSTLAASGSGEDDAAAAPAQPPDSDVFYLYPNLDSAETPALDDPPEPDQ